MSDRLHLDGDGVHAEISPVSAELRVLRIGGHDLLWPGGPAWPRSSPTLFPVIGRVEQDRILWQGRAYPMTLHGFAHDATFIVDGAGDRSLDLHLSATDATRAAYPFAFRLDVAFRIAEGGLAVTATVTNAGAVPLPASFGFHPGFRWTRPPAAQADRLEFLNPRHGFPAATLLRTRAARGLSSSGNGFALSDASFAEGALFFPDHASDGVCFTPRGAAHGIAVRFSGLPQLALWTPSGAPFFCIEPWAGAPDLPGFSGEIQDKPHGFLVPAGGRTTHWMHIGLCPPRPGTGTTGG